MKKNTPNVQEKTQPVFRKFPRTKHFPFSPGGTRDDHRHKDIKKFLGESVTITEKLDGSNVALTREGVYSRGGLASHSSFNPLKAIHSTIKEVIPKNHIVYAEWCYAIHSIIYPEIKNPLNLINVYNLEDDYFYGYDYTFQIAKHLGAEVVPLLFEIKEKEVQNLDVFKEMINTYAKAPSVYGPDREGIVASPKFNCSWEYYKNFTAKWVRADHVQTDEHWRNQPVIPHPNIQL